MQQSNRNSSMAREQRGNLQLVAADFAGRGHGDALGDGVLDRADDELGAEFLRAPVAEFDSAREIDGRCRR